MVAMPDRQVRPGHRPDYRTYHPRPHGPSSPARQFLNRARGTDSHPVTGSEARHSTDVHQN